MLQMFSNGKTKLNIGNDDDDGYCQASSKLRRDSFLLHLNWRQRAVMLLMLIFNESSDFQMPYCFILLDSER